MKKDKAISLFGGRVKLAKALGILPQAVSAMPENLGRQHSLKIIGAAWNSGLLRRGVRDGVIVKIDVNS